MGKYENKNAAYVLDNVYQLLDDMNESGTKSYRMFSVYSDLSIFDWFKENLTKSDLNKMRQFLEEAIKLGYDGYVCFKVGAKYCANGMWAHKAESEDGYSPRGEFIYRSFTTDYTCWDAKLEDGTMLSTIIGEWGAIKTAKQLEKALAEN